MTFWPKKGHNNGHFRKTVHHLKRQNGFTPIKSFQPRMEERDSVPTNRLVLQNHPVTPTHWFSPLADIWGSGTP